MNILLDLFLTFFKIGLFTFGGGYAMISIIEHNCVEKRKWLTDDEMADVIVIAESTPGPIAINCASYVGYKNKGFLGSVVATLGVVLPSFIIICLIAAFLDRFLDITLIANAFFGIKAAVGILIIDAGTKLMKKMPKKASARIIAVCSFAAMMLINVFSLHFSSVCLILIAGALSLALFAADNLKKAGDGAK